MIGQATRGGPPAALGDSFALDTEGSVGGSTGPVLIDTSLWIEALRESGSPVARRVVARAVEPGMALVNGLILSEILRGARDEGELRRLDRLFDATTCLPLDRPTWSRAARLGYDLRRLGVTVPTVDLVIAACALEADVPLLHVDVHFAMVAAHSELRQVLVEIEGAGSG